MCAIIGVAAPQGVGRPEWLAAGREAMNHRGPDDHGEWWSEDGRVGFGHRRLSILDLSSASQQPMIDAEAGLAIVFNGEIYNYRELRAELALAGCRFRSRGDTEVLLAAYVTWGADCLRRLNGMYAFAIYDSRAGKLFCARDRAGQKPFFYRHAGGELSFASELKGLLANPEAPRTIDVESLDCYLGLGFVPGDRCILSGYRKLPPGHSLEFDLAAGKLDVRCYWALPDARSPLASETVDEIALLAELEELLEDAVGHQLEADVPVGVLLSGGVDSSLITAMAVRHSTSVRTFTMSFPGHESLNESQHAKLIAGHFGTDHIELSAVPSSVELLPRLARLFDEPVVDSSMIPTFLLCELVRQHCSVALGGDGGDELFGGYDHYSRLLNLQKLSHFIPRSVARGVANLSGRMLPVGFKGRNYLKALDTDFAAELPLIANYFDAATRHRLMGNRPGYSAVAGDIYRARVEKQPDLIQRATRTDFLNYQAEDILVKIDRASMANSLELRAPMLDAGLIEFAYSKVPSRLKATARERKILLKRLARRILPPQFDLKRKVGFSIPLADWLRAGPYRDFFWDVLTARDALFDQKTVRSLIDNHERGFQNGERLFALVQFELWRKSYATQI